MSASPTANLCCLIPETMYSAVDGTDVDLGGAALWGLCARRCLLGSGHWRSTRRHAIPVRPCVRSLHQLQACVSGCADRSADLSQSDIAPHALWSALS